MRIVFAMACMLFACAAPALETARGLAAAGAPSVALARVEKLQPADRGAARWAEWETLRLSLLVGLKRYDETLKRAAALPDAMPPAALRTCLLAAARAAVAAGQPATARAHAARLLWQLDAPPDEVREARLLVIESHLAERQGETSFRAMLRFEQDYRPVGRAVAGRFVEGLLELGREKEAVNWLAALDDTGPLKLRLRLRAGLISPEAAIAQARAQIARKGRAGDGAQYWRVLSDAAGRLNDSALGVEATERLLTAGDDGDPGVPQAAALWQAYATEAQAVANRNRLLTGDDNAWLDFAARRLGSSPLQARALFGHLSRNGAARETRQAAQLQLVFSLRQGGLERAALSLFGEARAHETLDAQARLLLGRMAESHHLPAAAVRYWTGLPAPADVGPEEWQVQIAVVQWRAGMEDAALATMRMLAGQAKTLPEPAAGRALALARELFEAGKPASAEALYSMLLPLAGHGKERDVLIALGEVAESGSRFAAAADYFLRAAIADGTRTTDATATRARHAAAVNLLRAGHREDARAQFRWLVEHSKDPARVAAARRELSRP